VVPLYLDDKRLVKQVLAGDDSAFDRFFDENFARLYRFAIVRMADDPDAARDVTQIALTKAVRQLHTYRGESALFTWLCAICRNEMSDWLRQAGRRQAHIVLIEDHPEIQAAVDSFRAPPEDSPERQYRRAESMRLIQVALDRLPSNYGDVLEWKYVEGWSVREIASRLGIGTEATQSLIARARRAFADVYSAMMYAMGEDQDARVQR